MLDKAQAFFESYNKAIEVAYEAFFKNNKSEELLKQNENKAQEFLNNSIRNWTTEQNRELNNQSPSQFAAGIPDLNSAKDLFVIGAKLCDKDLPEIFIDKLRSFGEEADNVLLTLALDKELIESDEDVFISIMAIRLIGKWKLVNHINFLIDLIYELNEEKEIVVEEIVSALINIGIESCQKLISILEAKTTIGYIDEYVLSVVENVGKNNKNDFIFKCLKDVFIKMEDKILGAMCLSDYGDGRAIPTLRGYVEKNKHKIDNETYNEIKAAIKRLGGSVADL